MLYKVAFFPYTNTTVCRVQTCVEIYLFIVWFDCFHIFEVVQRSTKLYNNELIVHDIVNIYIYIGREVQRWTRKGMYQKQCSWMDYFCALVLISEAKVVYMYISFLALSLHSLYCDICFHQFWSCVIVLFLGSIICHLYIYMYL